MGAGSSHKLQLPNTAFCSAKLDVGSVDAWRGGMVEAEEELLCAMKALQMRPFSETEAVAQEKMRASLTRLSDLMMSVATRTKIAIQTQGPFVKVRVLGEASPEKGGHGGGDLFDYGVFIVNSVVDLADMLKMSNIEMDSEGYFENQGTRAPLCDADFFHGKPLVVRWRIRRTDMDVVESKCRETRDDTAIPLGFVKKVNIILITDGRMHPIFPIEAVHMEEWKDFFTRLRKALLEEEIRLGRVTEVRTAVERLDTTGRVDVSRLSAKLMIQSTLT